MKILICAGFVFVLSGCASVNNANDNKRKENMVGESGWIKDKNSGCQLWVRQKENVDSAAWSGSCVNGLAEGDGVAEFYKNGAIYSTYKGFYKDGKRDGRGVYVTARAKYDGNYKNDLASGKGVLTWKDGEKYDGDFKDGKKTGVGVWILPNGSRYVGGFLNDKLHGEGRLEISKNSKTIADWQGKGRWQKALQGGEVYVVDGRFENGKFYRTKNFGDLDKELIPNEFLIKTIEGCYLINPKPVAGEKVSWTGACRKGLAHGVGTLTWISNKNTPGKNLYMEGGFVMKPFSPGGALVESTMNSGCKFSLPVEGAERMEKIFDVEYVGGCPSGGGTLISESRGKGEAYIYLNGVLFASYKGKFARSAIPVDGELVFYTGTKFVFKDNVSFLGFVTPEMLEKWSSNTSVVRYGTKEANDSLFDIKVSFSASRPQPVEKTAKSFFISTNSISSSSELKMTYQVAPADIKKISGDSYVVSLHVSIDVKEKSTFGGWSAGGDKYSINRNVDIVVNKSNGYKASGSFVLSELDTYFSAMGANSKVEISKPTVSLVSVSKQ
ncbi:hypothetical protein [Dechloromonas sp. ZS-1]|uniref:MORN repeat-containing protein n=1 Tax=Dechloromonas sp. ZS-1 TaxID=3138067 RepID=UPI0031FD4026